MEFFRGPNFALLVVILATAVFVAAMVRMGSTSTTTTKITKKYAVTNFDDSRHRRLRILP